MRLRSAGWAVLAAAAIAGLAPGDASAYRGGYGYSLCQQKQAEAYNFERYAASDGRMSRGERRIADNLQAEANAVCEAERYGRGGYGHRPPPHYAPPPPPFHGHLPPPPPPPRWW